MRYGSKTNTSSNTGLSGRTGLIMGGTVLAGSHSQLDAQTAAPAKKTNGDDSKVSDQSRCEGCDKHVLIFVLFFVLFTNKHILLVMLCVTYKVICV